MADEILVFVRDVDKNEWPALPRSFKRGENVIRFRGHTYGLDRDDAIYGGRETIPVRIPDTDKDSFFTCPVEFLADEKGKQPNGDYLPREKMRNIIAQATSEQGRQETNRLAKDLVEQARIYEAHENLKIAVVPHEGRAVIRLEAPIRIVRSVYNQEFTEIEIEGLSATDIELLFCGMVSRSK
jgi:hypothetical protein